MFKKPLFWTNVASLVFVGLVAFSVAYGWTNPIADPPGGSGAISVDSSGNVTVAGNVSWNAFTLTAGNVPWARLTALPSDCLPNQYLDGLGAGGLLGSDCTQVGWAQLSGIPAPCPANEFYNNLSTGGCATGGGAGVTVTAPATVGRITKWTGVSSIGNSGITETGTTITVPADFVADVNLHGVQQTKQNAVMNSVYGSWGNGTVPCSTSPCPWTLKCDPGYYVIGLEQLTPFNNGQVQARIICAKL